MQQAATLQAMLGQSPRMQQAAQLRAVATPVPVQREEAPSPAWENNTGLPDELKAGVENLSGHSLDDVQVHYNSAKPAQLQAHAYAQGREIHVAPGQEQHLPHEAWHVVQQKQGRVKPTMQLKGVGVNDDSGLEREADVMGAKGMSAGRGTSEYFEGGSEKPEGKRSAQSRLSHSKQTRTVAQAKGAPVLGDERETPTTEEEVGEAAADADVYLARGVVPTQKKLLSDEMIAASFVSFSKIIRAEAEALVAEEVSPPTAEAAQAYVRQDRGPLVADLIEFTTKRITAEGFASGAGARISFVMLIKIKKKYLIKGSSGESGWIAKQNAPYEIVNVVKHDILGAKQTIGNDALLEEQRKEEVAELLWKTDGDKLPAYLQTLAQGERAAMGQRLLVLRQARRVASDEERTLIRERDSAPSIAASEESKSGDKESKV